MNRYEITFGKAMDSNNKAAVFEIEATTMAIAINKACRELQAVRDIINKNGFTVDHLHGLIVRDAKKIA